MSRSKDALARRLRADHNDKRHDRARCRDRRGKLSMVISDRRAGPLERGTLRRSRAGLLVLGLSTFCLGALAPAAARAALADLAEVEKLFRTGQYDQCAALAAQQV